jgi:hypothetical protein
MSATDASASSDRTGRWAAYVMLAGLVMLLRPYRGIVHDSRIYIGRAMADLDPRGVGQDPMFLADQQTGWSLLRPIARRVVEMAGPGLGAECLAIVGLALWTTAAVGLLTTVFGQKHRWPAVAALFALPAAYGAFGSFTFAEPWATPRLFAEAAALAGVALIMSRHWALGAAALLLAALFHPLMAAPVVGIVFIWMALAERRLWAAAAVGAAGVLAAAAAGLPLAERLLQPIDAEWRRFLELRSPYLFPQLWPVETWSRLLVQAATVLVARSLVPTEAARRLLSAVLIGAGLAIAAAALLSSSLLIAQLQLWRAGWVLAVLANAAAGWLAVAAWRHGRLGAAVLAALAAAWLLADGPVGGLIAVVAVASWTLLRRRADRPLSLPAVAGAWIAVGVLFGIWTVRRFLAVVEVAAGAPADARREIWLYVLAADLGLLFAVAAALWSAAKLSERAPRWASVTGAAALCLAGLLLFDLRSDFRRQMEGGQMRAGFEAAGPRSFGPRPTWRRGSRRGRGTGPPPYRPRRRCSPGTWRCP